MKTAADACSGLCELTKHSSLGFFCRDASKRHLSNMFIKLYFVLLRQIKTNTRLYWKKKKSVFHSAEILSKAHGPNQTVCLSVSFPIEPQMSIYFFVLATLIEVENISHPLEWRVTEKEENRIDGTTYWLGC